MRARLVLAVAAGLVAGPAPAQTTNGDASAQVAGLWRQMAGLELLLRSQSEQLSELRSDLDAIREAVATRVGGSGLAAPFLASPPPSSDAFGAAPAPVFAPRVEVDGPDRHDQIVLSVRRLDGAGGVTVGQVELAPDQPGADVPIDVGGELYVVEWSTLDGYEFPLVLRDAASGHAAATVRVKPHQSRGLFVFVGYRLE